jgi:hypothetical protein
MRKKDVIAGVRRSWAFLKERGLGYEVRDYHPLPLNEEFRRMALGGAKTYMELYRTALSTLSYNIMLRDFSILQYSWSGEDELRYGFLPNPMLCFEAASSDVSDLWSAVSAGAATVEEVMHELADLDQENGTPLIRYENSVKQHKGLRHPCSHFHIGFDSRNRWPVERILTPYAFTLLVTKLYFADCWLNGCSNDEASNFEPMLADERRNNCRLLPPTLFTSEERRSFHVA